MVIDVSKWQGVIDWEKVAEHADIRTGQEEKIDGVILRAGYGRHLSQKDRCFDSNYAGATAVGLPVGAYWYSYAETPEQAVEEAKVCLEVIKRKKFDYPIYFDIEDKVHLNLSKETCTEICKAFCNTLEDAGYFAGIYSYDYFFKDYLDASLQGRYSCWVARVSSSPPKYCKSYAMWQYSHTGRVSGINGNVDLNECYKNFPNIMRKNGLNGYPKEAK